MWFQQSKKQTKVFVIILFSVLSVVVWLAFPAARKGPLGFGPPAAMTTFHPEDDSYTISYPANWVSFELRQGNHGDHEVIAIILVSGRQLANVTVARKPFPNSDVNDILDWGHARAAQHEDYVSISPPFLSGSGLNSFIQDYRWSSSAVNAKNTMRCRDNYIFTDNIGYAIAFCSREKDWSSLENIYDEMRKSFSVNGENK